jgi:hypothetical protein
VWSQALAVYFQLSNSHFPLASYSAQLIV